MTAAVRQHAGALLGLASPIFFRQRAELAEIAIKNRLPAIAPFREAAEAGVLMAYGANLPTMLRRAADYVDRILKGTSRLICQWSSLRSSSWSSTSRPRRRWI
jgi:putative ABC transport system substrate-binding protein